MARGLSQSNVLSQVPGKPGGVWTSTGHESSLGGGLVPGSDAAEAVFVQKPGVDPERPWRCRPVAAVSAFLDGSMPPEVEAANAIPERVGCDLSILPPPYSLSFPRLHSHQ